MNNIQIKDFVRDILDFPKKGVVFKDITPILSSAEATEAVLQQLLAPLKNERIDKVAAIESRGFFFGILLAHALKVGFVPIRKPGKLPGEVTASCIFPLYSRLRVGCSYWFYCMG